MGWWKKYDDTRSIAEGKMYALSHMRYIKCSISVKVIRYENIGTRKEVIRGLAHFHMPVKSFPGHKQKRPCSIADLIDLYKSFKSLKHPYLNARMFFTTNPVS